MKTRMKSLNRTILLLLLILIVFSCRRDDDDLFGGNPLGSDVPPPPVTFPDGPLNLISPFELELGCIDDDLPVEKIKKLGEELGGSEHGWKSFMEGGLEIGHILWEAYDYMHTEALFAEVNNKLDEIQLQITDLDAKMTSLLTDLKISNLQLESEVASKSIEAAMTAIGTAMDSSSVEGFMYYPVIARWYKTDSVQWKSTMMDARDYIPTYASKIYHDNSASSIKSQINAMHDGLCVSLTDADALKCYAKALLASCQGKIIDSASAMSAYLYLESYFLKVVNSQFQAATIYMNAASYLDPDNSKHYAEIYWNNSFSGIIKSETDHFLDIVDYMAVNLAEYRTQDRFLYDMQYADAGLAPDNVFKHALARGQFMANRLKGVAGVPVPRISGHIFIPSVYSGSGANSPSSVSVKIGSSVVTASCSNFTSQIPYTYWKPNSDNVPTCYPGNTWSVYRFSTSATDTIWPCTPQPMQVITNGTEQPWTHCADITGTITPKYYNPGNPQKISNIRTDSCTVQFAYFSACWQGGNLLPANSQSLKKLPDFFELSHYDEGYSDVFNLSVPSAMRCKVQYSQEQGNYYTSPTKITSLTYSAEDFGRMSANGTLEGAKKQCYCIVDSRYCNVATSEQLPNLTPAGGKNEIEVWASYSGSVIDPLVNNKPWINISLGTNYSKNKYNNYYYELGDIFNDKLNITTTNFTFPSKFIKKAIATNTVFNPGFQYFYYSYHNTADAAQISINLNYNYQFVYTGFYSLN